MTLEEIKTMIERQGVYEISYRKDDIEHLWRISNIEISKEYPGKCILAYCQEVKKNLTFSINKIAAAKKYWIEILDEDLVADIEGLYVLACMEDNYIGRRFAYIKKGERFSKYGWALAFHFVPPFSDSYTNGWIKNEREAPNNKLSLFAYIGGVEINCSSNHLVEDVDGINYYLFDRLNTHDREAPVSEDKKDSITILGRYDIAVYDERNLGAHLKCWWAKHNKE